jgi:hypothetical protein
MFRFEINRVFLHRFQLTSFSDSVETYILIQFQKSLYYENWYSKRN